jgi:1,2-phenylacetyl-CoA epoxidase catalytic subunit
VSGEVEQSPLASVASEWLRRVDAEYQSAAVVQNYTLWLIQAGASPDLIRDGLRIVDDELVHAEMSYQVYVEAGGRDVPAIDQDNLGLRRMSEDIYEDLIRVGVQFFCLGETIAVPLFQRMRKHTENEVARAALDRILVDEVRHRDFGWTLLDWLLEVRPSLREQLQENLGAMFGEVVSNYGKEKDDQSLSQSERQWGLISRGEYSEILERCLTRDYQPRFERCGVQLPAGITTSP